jgi:hypothetical protein
MVMTPLRAGPGFASTLNVTVPGPDPDAPPVTMIHAAPLAAVHAQPAPAVTFTDPVPPPTTIGVAIGEIEIVQPLS